MTGRRRSLLCRISDGTGALITLRFFHFSLGAGRPACKQGISLRCWGQIRRMSTRRWRWYILNTGGLMPMSETPDLEQNLTPVYPLTQGISQFKLRHLTGPSVANPVRGRRRPHRVAAGYGILQSVFSVQSPNRQLQVSYTGRRRDADLDQPGRRHAPCPATAGVRGIARASPEPALDQESECRSTAGCLPLSTRNADGRIKTFLDSLPFEADRFAQQRVFAEIRSDMLKPVADAATGAGGCRLRVRQ